MCFRGRRGSMGPRGGESGAAAGVCRPGAARLRVLPSQQDALLPGETFSQDKMIDAAAICWLENFQW